MQIPAPELATAITGSDGAGVEELIGLGADHLRRCYQCGTCSVVCPRTPLDRAFPRKEMVWAQWGLTDRLAADADAWLCVQCNECIVNCPVDARPGDLMAALRNFQIRHYAVPRFMTRVTEGPRQLALAFVLPVIFVAALLALALGPGHGHFMPGGRILFTKMIPQVYTEAVSLALSALVIALAAIGARRFWRAIVAAEGPVERRRPFLPSLGAALWDALTHRDFKDCGTNYRRTFAHMAVFYGFWLLFAATVGAFLYTVVFKWVGLHWHHNELSLPLWDPVKIIGLLGFVALAGGGTWLTVQRLRAREHTGSSTYFDWFFVALLYLTALTGFALMILRYVHARVIAYPAYLVHLVLIYALFAYFPYSKFAHLLYRLLANTHARQIGRQPGSRPDTDGGVGA